MSNVRIRFAPSPTGFPHVGNIRTALFNWLFARHSGGQFIVRIEDTDVARTVPGAVDKILEGLRWLGLDYDEGPGVGGLHGPYFQSQRLELYRLAADDLVKKGYAYRCYCSTERLEQMRAEQSRLKQPTGYDRLCRTLTPADCLKIEEKGIVPVIRFKTPLDGETRFHDLIRGEVAFQNSTIDDFVLLKSDGYPTYHLANIVDDHFMEISHVMRAEEWLSSTPRHLMLYAATGYAPPQFAHMPMILGPDRSKLSKRHGAVSILEYRDQGYLAEAMVNFLALLGWSLDDKTEIMSRAQIIDGFTIERISKTSAIFNMEKLNWMNGVYIRSLTPEEFYAAAEPYLMTYPPAGEAVIGDEAYVRRALPLVQERAKTMVEVVELTRFFFTEELTYNPADLISKGMDKAGTINALTVARERIAELLSFDAAALEGVLRPLAAELGLKAGQLFGALRTATTGLTAAPPLFQTMEVLGRERSLKRIKQAIQLLEESTLL